MSALVRFWLVCVIIATSKLACAPPTNWTDIHSIDELQDAFNRDQGNVRLVLIFSPT